MSSRRGLALLIVVGVLGILAVLAAAFVTMAQLERRASAQRLNATKALLLARSGIEDALARLTAGQTPSYGGEDWDNSGTLNLFEPAAEILNPGTLDVEACPVRHTLRPSFFAQDIASLGADLKPAPKRLLLKGRERGYSGLLSTGSYALRVSGEEGIYVNGGDLSSAGEHASTYDATLKRILGNLAEELGAPLVRADGEALVLQRPAGGWASLAQAAQALGWSQAKRDAFGPSLAFHAWVDRKVIRPNIDPAWPVPASGYVGIQTPAAWAEVKVGQRDTPLYVPTSEPLVPDVWFGGYMNSYGVGAPWSGKRAFNPHTNSYAPDFERDGSGGIVGRAPVNLNWAKSHPPVLRALLKDIAGIRLDQGFFVNYYAGPTIPQYIDQGIQGFFYAATLSTSDIDMFVTALQAHTGFPTWTTEFPDWDQTASFDSWDEFSRFVDLKLAALARPQRDLLKANFNPNTDLNKFNPGESVFKELDKSDLTRYSAEFSFRTPHLALSAAGRILKDGRLLAEQTLQASIAFGQVRFTTQSEFCAGNQGDLALAGDETLPRLPGDAEFIEKTSSLDRTSGSRLTLSQGLALQTYPEPQWRRTACPPPATYDGNLQLATLETNVAGTPGITFLAAFDDRYDATWAAGLGVKACKMDTCQAAPATSLLGSGPAGSSAVLNMIYPDGCYSETRRAPGYEAQGNLGDGLQGILSFWVKPTRSPEFVKDAALISAGPRSMFLTLGLLSVDPLANSYATMFDSTQAMRIGMGWIGGSQTYAPIWGGGVENCYANSDSQFEQVAQFAPGSGYKPFWGAHRWHLVTYQWNLLATTSQNYACISVNAVPGNGTFKPWNYTTLGMSGGSPLDTLTRNCFREDGSTGTPYFYLGFRVYPVLSSAGADATLDEFLCVTRTTDMGDGNTLALDRWKSGRYSKEDEALDPAKPEYGSCKVPLPKGTVLVRADWTLVLPRIPAATTQPDLWPSANRAFFGTGANLVSGQTADAAITLMDGAGVPLLPARLTRTGAPFRVRPPGGTFRFGVNIRPGLSDNTDSAGVPDKDATPLLESPVFDDITFTTMPREGPRILAWERP